MKGASVEIVDLGYANGWNEIPEIVQKCADEDHVLRYEVTGRCLIQRWCDVCGYTYRVDSSD